MRAAQARAARRGGDTLAQAAPEPEPEPAEAAPDPDDRATETSAEPAESFGPGPAPHDQAGSLAWTGLVLLTLILGGFMAAILFMLG
jgi:hypothetical protein